jgi:DNA-binding MarR family transcriptional regulator
MTIGEFLQPLANSTHLFRVLGVLYFHERYHNRTALTAEEIREALRRARIPKSAKLNVADVLAKAGALVDTAGVQGSRKLWTLTETGRRTLREKLNLPAADVEIEHDIGSLEKIIRNVTNPDAKDYLEEAVKCLSVGALRACVVFVWSGAIRTLQEQMLRKKTKINAALRKHDPNGRHVASLDDFAYVKDQITLLAARDLGLFDKNEKDTLKEALDLRNRSGHPGKYRPGPKKVSGFIEDITSIIFS